MSFWSAPQQTRLTSVALEKVYWHTRQLQSPTVAESSRLDCCNNFVHRQQNTRTRFTLKFNLANVFCAHCKRFQSPCLTDNWSKIFTVCLPLTTPMPNALQQHSFQCLPQNNLVSQYQDVKPFWILLQQEITKVLVPSWTLRRAKLQSNHTNAQFLQAECPYRLNALPVCQPTVSHHWRHWCPLLWWRVINIKVKSSTIHCKKFM